MITNTTSAAAPTNVINSEQKQFIFFGVGSASQTSQTFTVDQQPFYLSAYNLGADDVITVQQVYGQGSGTEVASFSPVNGPVTLNQNRTKLRIDHPGRYQLLHTGSSALGTFTVAGGAAVMTSDPLGDLAEALYQIFTTLGGNIAVTAPITLTGSGTTALPYNIGFQADTVVGSSSITVTGAGTTASPYVVSVNASAPAGSAPPNFVEVTGTFPIVVSGTGTSGSPYDVTLPNVVVGPFVNAVGDGLNVGSFTHVSAIGSGIGTNCTLTDCSAMGIDSLTAGGTGVFTKTVALGAATYEVTAGGSFTVNNATAVGFEAALNCSVAGTFLGALAGSGETHTGTIIINDSGGAALNATQNNQIVLGTSTQTQLVTAGSIIAGGAISASDERLKENIEGEFEALAALDKLSPVTFMWNREAVRTAKIPLNEDEYEKVQHGFIAQEVEDYFPELIETIDRGAGPYKFLRYERMISILVAAVQELSLEVKSLKENR